MSKKRTEEDSDLVDLLGEEEDEEGKEGKVIEKKGTDKDFENDQNKKLKGRSLRRGGSSGYWDYNRKDHAKEFYEEQNRSSGGGGGGGSSSSSNRNPCTYVCMVGSYVWAYLSYLCWYYPSFFACGCLLLVIWMAMIFANMILNPIEEYGRIANDWTNIGSKYDLQVGKVQHWCLSGHDHHCKCEDPLTPIPRSQYRSWVESYRLNQQRIKKYEDPLEAMELDVVFFGESVVEEMDGRWMGIRPNDELRTIQRIFRQHFDKTTGAPIEGIALGIAGDTANNVLWRLLEGELPEYLNPKIWWIVVGMNDLARMQCSEEIVEIGILRIVEEILNRRPDAHIVINSLLPMADLRGGLLPTAMDYKDAFVKYRTRNKVIHTDTNTGGYQEEVSSTKKRWIPTRKRVGGYDPGYSAPRTTKTTTATAAAAGTTTTTTTTTSTTATKDNDGGWRHYQLRRERLLRQEQQQQQNQITQQQEQELQQQQQSSLPPPSPQQQQPQQPQMVRQLQGQLLEQSEQQQQQQQQLQQLQMRQQIKQQLQQPPPPPMRIDTTALVDTKPQRINRYMDDDVVSTKREQKRERAQIKHYQRDKFNPTIDMSKHFAKRGRGGLARRTKLPLWTSIYAINQELRKFCTNHDRVSFFDATGIFTEQKDGTHSILLSERISARGHPTELGYKLWEDAMMGHITKILQKLKKEQETNSFFFLEDDFDDDTYGSGEMSSSSTSEDMDLFIDNVDFSSGLSFSWDNDDDDENDENDDENDHRTEDDDDYQTSNSLNGDYASDFGMQRVDGGTIEKNNPMNGLGQNNGDGVVHDALDSSASSSSSSYHGMETSIHGDEKHGDVVDDHIGVRGSSSTNLEGVGGVGEGKWEGEGEGDDEEMGGSDGFGGFGLDDQGEEGNNNVPGIGDFGDGEGEREEEEEEEDDDDAGGDYDGEQYLQQREGGDDGAGYEGEEYHQQQPQQQQQPGFGETLADVDYEEADVPGGRGEGGGWTTVEGDAGGYDGKQNLQEEEEEVVAGDDGAGYDGEEEEEYQEEEEQEGFRETLGGGDDDDDDDEYDVEEENEEERFGETLGDDDDEYEEEGEEDV